MHARVKRLDAPVHHLRETGQVAPGARVDGGVDDRVQSAAGGVQLVTESLKAARERAQAGLVANRQQSSWQVAPPSNESPVEGFGAPPRGCAASATPPCQPRRPAPPPG